jgi:hypothetical protein
MNSHKQGTGARFETRGMLWKYGEEVLTYRLGPWSLGQSTFRGARTENSFLRHPALPDWSMVGPQVQVLSCPALPVTQKLAALTFRRLCALRYTPRREVLRCVHRNL